LPLLNGGNVCAIGTILAVITLAGCETYKAETAAGRAVPKLRRAAILSNPFSKEKRHIADDIAAVLEKRGIQSVVVPVGEAVPKDVDAYFTYNDRWAWDLTMYLDKLEIQLHETGTGEVLTSAKYRQGAVHRYPSPTDIADNLIGQILGQPPKPPRRADAPENRELIKR
jgi:hypothetical protein